MIRPFTLLTAILFCLSGAYLFAIKHRAQVLDDQIAATAQATRLDLQRIRVLQAQWALEADPARLSRLAGNFTDLQPMKPNQLVTLAALRSDLPAPGSAPPTANPQDQAPNLPVTAANPVAVADAAPPATPHIASKQPAPAKIATAKPALVPIEHKMPTHALSTSTSRLAAIASEMKHQSAARHAPPAELRMAQAASHPRNVDLLAEPARPAQNPAPLSSAYNGGSLLGMAQQGVNN